MSRWHGAGPWLIVARARLNGQRSGQPVRATPAGHGRREVLRPCLVHSAFGAYMKTFYLIDGHAQLFRAYYAPFRDLTSPTGEPVKAVYVFTQLLLNLLKNIKPDYLAVAFDVSDSTTLRKGWFPEYKANRDRSPEDLQIQYERIRQVIEALELPVFELEGYEADDVIA